MYVLLVAFVFSSVSVGIGVCIILYAVRQRWIEHMKLLLLFKSEIHLNTVKIENLRRLHEEIRASVLCFTEETFRHLPHNQKKALLESMPVFRGLSVSFRGSNAPRAPGDDVLSDGRSPRVFSPRSSSLSSQDGVSDSVLCSPSKRGTESPLGNIPMSPLIKHMNTDCTSVKQTPATALPPPVPFPSRRALEGEKQVVFRERHGSEHVVQCFDFGFNRESRDCQDSNKHDLTGVEDKKNIAESRVTSPSITRRPPRGVLCNSSSDHGADAFRKNVVFDRTRPESTY
jgi:hypothetical protein